MISVDPGVHGSGVAFWFAGRLSAVRYYKPSEISSVLSVVIECPQIYPGVKSKGNPNDLIKLAFEAGRIIGLFNPVELRVIKPRDWKGTIKKEAMLKRILSKLTEEELAIVKAANIPKAVEHNVLDAIGIGLWHLGRL